MKLNEIILNQSWPIMVVYYDETLVGSWYLTIKYFITDGAMGPLRQIAVLLDKAILFFFFFFFSISLSFLFIRGLFLKGKNLVQAERSNLFP